MESKINKDNNNLNTTTEFKQFNIEDLKQKYKAQKGSNIKLINK